MSAINHGPDFLDCKLLEMPIPPSRQHQPPIRDMLTQDMDCELLVQLLSLTSLSQ
jgi:hypothetical protein